ncbi:hypothetical protein [Nocardia sp. BMG51109]|uniref:hypothetical protein n=1 Tax=Nocardia sp. BMG51109 TaxID=1056816 RepID=UPI00046491D9|nr:hypothetical protein [Nocardia sp. BMG51109]
MPHDSNPAAEPVLVPLHMPAPRASLVGGLVRAVSAESSPADGSGLMSLDGSGLMSLDGDAADERVADFLAAAAHADTGFVVRTSSGERALALVAATAAALCGDDIRAALRRPDVEFLRGLQPPAVRALREVLLAIESDEPEEVALGLAVLASDIAQTPSLPPTPQ